MACSLQLWALRTSASQLFKWVQTLLLRAACHLCIKKDLTEVWCLGAVVRSFQHQCVPWMHGTSSLVIHGLHQAHAPSPFTLFPQLKHVLHALWEKLDITEKPRPCLYLEGSDLGFNFKSVVQYTTVIWVSTSRASLTTPLSPRSLILIEDLSASLGPPQKPPWVLCYGAKSAPVSTAWWFKSGLRFCAVLKSYKRRNGVHFEAN